MNDNTVNLKVHKASKDELARREIKANNYIHSMDHGFFLFGLPQKRMYALLDATLEEKEAYVRGSKRRILKSVAILGLVFVAFQIYRYFVPEPPTATVPQPSYATAGVVEDIQLHSTAFSTDTTVKTSTGIFQVSGGVSASVGDEAKIKREAANSLRKTSLCINSQIKSECYPVM